MDRRTHKTSSFSVIIIFVCMALGGLALGSLIPVKLYPDHSMPELTLSFRLPKSSASVVESELTSPLEKALSGIDGLTDISSQSGDGWGIIRLKFDRFVDMEKVRFDASTRIRSVWENDPQKASYPIISMGRSSDGDAQTSLSYSISAPYASSVIQMEVEKKMLPLLRSLNGVGDVSVMGVSRQEYLLSYDYDQIRILGISPDAIGAAIEEHYQSEYIGLAGIPDSIGGESFIRIRFSEGENSDLDLSQIFVQAADKSLLPLSRLLTVRKKDLPQQRYYRVNGLNSIYVRIMSSPSANQIDLSRQVNRIMAESRGKLLPGYQLTKLYDSAESIRKELSNIYIRSGITILLLLLFTLLVTRNGRYIAIVTICLAANIAIAFALYYVFQLEIQVYTLAAITISLSFIIDNSIVMIEHLRRRGDRTVITAILASTLTTVSAMIVVFFLPEAQRKNLGDFAFVIIVNLCVSILVGLFLVPALFDRLSFVSNRKPVSWRNRSRIVRGFSVYRECAAFLYRHKGWCFTGFVLLFGLPLFLLPKELEGNSPSAALYNKTIGSTAYKKIRPYTDVAFGGLLRPFVKQISSGSDDKWTNKIYVSVVLPSGSTIEATNEYVTKLERFLAQAKGISYFETSISGTRRAHIKINFKDDYAKGNYPYELHQGLVGKILSIGGGYCRISGLKNISFNNIQEKRPGSYVIKLLGYNYHDLLAQAQQEVDYLSTRPMIRNINIISDYASHGEETELHLHPYTPNQQYLGMNPYDLVRAVNDQSRTEHALNEVFIDDQPVRLSIAARRHGSESKWLLANKPIVVGGKTIKLKDYGEMKTQVQPPVIVRENKNFVLYVCYDYMGNNIKQIERFKSDEIKRMNAVLPIGYRALEPEFGFWEDGRSDLIWALVGIIILIFFITSILFDSFRYSLIVICIIPVSFIGIFLVFTLFRLPFDEGGFAAMVILCGITVNASIYLISDYLHHLRTRKQISPLHAYGRAVRNKSFSIALTVISTVLGFIPFVVDPDAMDFWYSLSIGVIFGLLFSTAMVFLLLPCFLGKERVAYHRKEINTQM